MALGKTIPLRAKSPCWSCKLRRKKCSEGRPVCEACLRLGYLCVYGKTFDATKEHAESRQLTRRLPSRRVFEETFILRPQIAVDGGFNRLPVRNDQTRDVLVEVPKLLNVIMDHMWPFQPAAASLSGVQSGWMGPTFSNKALLLGSTAVSTGMQAARGTSAQAKATHARYAAELFAEVRSAVKECQDNATQPPPYGTMIGSILIPWIYETHDCNPSVLRRVADGAHFFVNRMGGIQRFLESRKYQVLLTIVKAEWIASLTQIDKPHYLQEYPRPAMSDLLTSPNLYIGLQSSLLRFCDSEIMQLAQDLKLLAFYRYSDEQRHLCPTIDEFWQLTSLLNYVDLQQCHLQNRYAGTETLSECMTYALILVRIFLIGDKIAHCNLGMVIFKRLERALERIDPIAWPTENASEAHIWLLTVMTCILHPESNSTLLSAELTVALDHYFGASRQHWPLSWYQRIYDILISIVWHPRFDLKLASAYKHFEDADMRK